jgi:hypothetical protein
VRDSDRRQGSRSFSPDCVPGVTREGGTGGRGERVVVQDEVLRPLVVVRDVIPRELRVGVERPVLAEREPVHPSVVVRGAPRGEVVRKGRREPLRTSDEGYLLPPLHAHRRSARAGVATEQVVEAPVLEHQGHDVFDRPSRLDRSRQPTVTAVETRSPKQEERNRPAAAAADRFMNVRRVSRFGNIDRSSVTGLRVA